MRAPTRLISSACLALAFLAACGAPDGDRGITGPPAAPAASVAGAGFSPWSEPVSLGPGFNTEFFDQQAMLSKDGLSLYFNSSRPEHPGDAVLDANLWVARRGCIDCPWQDPVLLPATVNSPVNDGAPNLSRDGHWLFFASNRLPGRGNDLWVAYRPHVHDDLGWEEAVNLGPGVNTVANEAAPSYFENDDLGVPQLFLTSNRLPGPNGLPQIDIFVSHLRPDGTWGEPVPIHEINHPTAADQRPSIHHNGLVLYFFSNRTGAEHIWYATRPSIGERWSAPQVVPSPIADVTASQPFIHSHGRTETLFFTRNVGVPGSPNLDMFASTRTRGGR